MREKLAVMKKAVEAILDHDDIAPGDVEMADP